DLRPLGGKNPKPPRTPRWIAAGQHERHVRLELEQSADETLAGDAEPAADAGRELPAEHEDAHEHPVPSSEFRVPSCSVSQSGTRTPGRGTAQSSPSRCVYTTRRTSATLEACAKQPPGACGGSPSKDSEIEPSPDSRTCARSGASSA